MQIEGDQIQQWTILVEMPTNLHLSVMKSSSMQTMKFLILLYHHFWHCLV